MTQDDLDDTLAGLIFGGRRPPSKRSTHQNMLPEAQIAQLDDVLSAYRNPNWKPGDLAQFNPALGMYSDPSMKWVLGQPIMIFEVSHERRAAFQDWVRIGWIGTEGHLNCTWTEPLTLVPYTGPRR